MARERQSVEGTFADAWKPTQVGQVLEGFYLGSQDAKGDRGPFKAYHIKTEDGQRMSVSGAGLNTIMPQIPRKTYVWITYQGTEKQKKGDMKVFAVECEKGTKLLDPMDSEEQSPFDDET